MTETCHKTDRPLFTSGKYSFSLWIQNVFFGGLLSDQFVVVCTTDRYRKQPFGQCHARTNQLACPEIGVNLMVAQEFHNKYVINTPYQSSRTLASRLSSNCDDTLTQQA